MKIAYKRPPNYNKIKEKLTFDDKVTIFAYGDTIYNPSKLRLPVEIIVHEKVHGRQQSEMGTEVWWDKYLEDVEFRLAQELEAYREQYSFVCSKYGKNEDYLEKLAEILASPMYGNIISLEEARNGIRECLG